MTSKSLTTEMVMARCKTDNLGLIKNLNLWGNEIADISLIRQMPNMEVLSLSVNKITTLKDFANSQRLTELYLRKNMISDLREVRYLSKLPSLRILWLSENPCSETNNYRKYVIKMLPNLVKLDNKNITSEEKLEAESVRVDSSQQDMRGYNDNNNQNSYQEPPMGRYRSYEEMHRDNYDENYNQQVNRPNRNMNDNNNMNRGGNNKRVDHEYSNNQSHQSSHKGSYDNQSRPSRQVENQIYEQDVHNFERRQSKGSYQRGPPPNNNNNVVAGGGRLKNENVITAI